MSFLGMLELFHRGRYPRNRLVFIPNHFTAFGFIDHLRSSQEEVLIIVIEAILTTKGNNPSIIDLITGRQIPTRAERLTPVVSRERTAMLGDVLLDGLHI